MTDQEMTDEAREMALRDLEAQIKHGRKVLASGDLDDYARVLIGEELARLEQCRENIPPAILWFYDGLAKQQERMTAPEETAPEDGR